MMSQCNPVFAHLGEISWLETMDLRDYTNYKAIFTPGVIDMGLL